MAGNCGGELGGGFGSALLEALFTQAPVGLLIVDADLRVQRVNTLSRGDRGTAVAGLLGRPVTEALNTTSPEGVETMARAVLSTGVPVLDRLVVGRPTAEPGPEHVYSVSVFRLQDSNGLVLGAVVSLTDVTEHEREGARAAVRDAARKKIGSSLDAITTCRELADVAVPEFADAVVLDVLDTVVRGNEPRSGRSSVTSRCSAPPSNRQRAGRGRSQRAAPAAFRTPRRTHRVSATSNPAWSRWTRPPRGRPRIRSGAGRCVRPGSIA